MNKSKKIKKYSKKTLGLCRNIYVCLCVCVCVFVYFIVAYFCVWMCKWCLLYVYVKIHAQRGKLGAVYRMGLLFVKLHETKGRRQTSMALNI